MHVFRLECQGGETKIWLGMKSRSNEDGQRDLVGKTKKSSKHFFEPLIILFWAPLPRKKCEKKDNLGILAFSLFCKKKRKNKKAVKPKELFSSPM